MAGREQLIKSLQARLVPEFVNLGFEVVPLFADERRSSEVRSSFPLGRLKRTRKDGTVELVEIQLEKYGQAKFRLNFGVVPVGGIDHPVKHVPQTEAVVGYLPCSAELYSRPFFRKWFTARPSAKCDFDQAIEQLLDRVIGLVPEVVAWLSRGEVGPHVRQIGKRTLAH